MFNTIGRKLPSANWPLAALIPSAVLLAALLLGVVFYRSRTSTSGQPSSPTITTSISPTNNWSLYENQEISLTLLYPPGWEVIETPDRLAVAFGPSDNSETPAPFIGVDFNPAWPTRRPYPGLTDAEPVTVAGIAGMQYQDRSKGYAGTTIMLPYRGGTLRIENNTQILGNPNSRYHSEFSRLLESIALKP